MFNGRFCHVVDPGQTQEVLSGQAVCFGLLNECYKLVRRMVNRQAEVDPVLVPIQNELVKVVDRLEEMVKEAEIEHQLDQNELIAKQQIIDGIDSQRQDGKFVDTDGKVPEGQATLHEQLNRGYDMIHECLVYLSMQDETDTTEEDRSEAFSIRQKLSKAIETTEDSAKAVYGNISASLEDLIGKVLVSAKENSSRLRSIVASTLGRAARLVSEFEPVDESLKPIHDRLVKLRDSLKDLRNLRNQEWLDTLSEGKHKTPAFADQFAEEVDANFAEWKEINQLRIGGQFLNQSGIAPSGQLVLSHLCDECHFLLIEIIDENSI